jgi:hypothetical protein
VFDALGDGSKAFGDIIGDMKRGLVCTTVAHHVFNGKTDEALKMLREANHDDLVRLRITFIAAAAVVRCADDGSELKLPPEIWQEMSWCDYRVIDPDGWRYHEKLGSRDWKDPITKEEFLNRLHSNSTYEVKWEKRQS